MHCFYLGLFQRHMREVWGMNPFLPDGDGLGSRHKSTITTEEEMIWAHQVFSTGGKLKDLKKHLLVALCWEAGLRYVGTKGKLAKWLDEVRLFDCLENELFLSQNIEL